MTAMMSPCMNAFPCNLSWLCTLSQCDLEAYDLLAGSYGSGFRWALTIALVLAEHHCQTVH